MSTTNLLRLHIPHHHILTFRHYKYQPDTSTLTCVEVSERTILVHDHNEHPSKVVIDTLMQKLNAKTTWLTPWSFSDITATNYMYHLSKYNDANESTGVIKITHYPKTQAPLIREDDNVLRIYHENDEGYNAYYLTFVQKPTKEYVNELIASMVNLPEVSDIYISEELDELIDTPKGMDDYVEFLFERTDPCGPEKVADFATAIVNHLPVSKQVDEASGDVTITSLYTGNQLILTEQYVKARLRVFERYWLDSLSFGIVGMGGTILGKVVEDYRQWIEKVKPQ